MGCDDNDLMTRAELLLATCAAYNEDDDPGTLAEAVADLCALCRELLDRVRP